jgi:hypothetical protein
MSLWLHHDDNYPDYGMEAHINRLEQQNPTKIQTQENREIFQSFEWDQMYRKTITTLNCNEKSGRDIVDLFWNYINSSKNWPITTTFPWEDGFSI